MNLFVGIGSGGTRGVTLQTTMSSHSSRKPRASSRATSGISDGEEREQEPTEEQGNERERHTHFRVFDEADLDAARSCGFDDDQVGDGPEDREVAGERGGHGADEPGAPGLGERT